MVFWATYVANLRNASMQLCSDMIGVALACKGRLFSGVSIEKPKTSNAMSNSNQVMPLVLGGDSSHRNVARKLRKLCRVRWYLEC